MVQQTPPTARAPMGRPRLFLVFAAAYAACIAVSALVDYWFALPVVPSLLILLVLWAVANSTAARITRTGSHVPRIDLPYVGDVSPGWSVRLEEPGARRTRMVYELMRRCNASLESADQCTRERGSIVAERIGEPEARDLVAALRAAGATVALVSGDSREEGDLT